MSYSTDVIVIGAGVVGLAVGRAFARAGLETLVLEREDRIGSGVSSRNSEVIHAGLYYEPGSLKALCCLRGKELLYDFLQSREVPYRRCGKLVVAANRAEREVLLRIGERASACGVTDLELIDAAALRELEPAVAGEAALLSPSSGIVDSHGLMRALQREIEEAGGAVVLACPVESGRLSTRGPHELRTGGREAATIRSRLLVNASGLQARDTWLRLGGRADSALIPQQLFAKGHYWSYPGPSPFSRLVYPLPEAGGLGVHATLDVGGQLRFGPDVRWVEAIDYGFDDTGRQRFAAAIRKYFPALDASRLQPGYTGIRPRIAGPEAGAADFAILAEAEHGIAGFCSLHGIESPGLTACLAIAEQVVEALLGAPQRRL